MQSRSFFLPQILKRAVLLLFMAMAVPMFMAAPSWAKTLTIGTISANPVDETRTFQPFANYLAKSLSKDGIDAAKVVIATDIKHMVWMLKSGEADLFIDSSVTALVVNTLSGSEFMLRRWKKKRSQYRSVIFVRADSPINTLEDLKGKIIAFEEPFSTSGYMLPALTLTRRGLKLHEVATVKSSPPAETVGYIMGYDNETQATWLDRGRVDAAAMAEKDYEEFSKTSLKPLRILYFTPDVPYHVVSHRAGLDAQLVLRIKDELKSAHETEPGKTILMDFESTAKFDDIPVTLLKAVVDFQPYLNLVIVP